MHSAELAAGPEEATLLIKKNERKRKREMEGKTERGRKTEGERGREREREGERGREREQEGKRKRKGKSEIKTREEKSVSYRGGSRKRLLSQPRTR